ncbi:MAG: ATP-binding protein [bacterium]
MKLALKFALSFIAVTIVVWGVASYIRVQREINLFELDIRRDHESIGIDLAAAVADIWRLGGEKAAREFVDHANETKSHVSIALLSIDSMMHSLVVQQTESSSAILDEMTVHAVSVLYEDSTETEWVYTYVPVSDGTTTGSVLELCESLSHKNEYVSSTIRNAVLYTLTLGVIAGGIAMLLGAVFIVRPVRALMKKARQVAEGDLRSDVRLRQADELGELGIELNAMSSRLAVARHEAAIESAAHETATQQLRHADRLTTVGKLAAAVAHELGTPLNVIKARARMIAEKEVEGDGAISSGLIIVEQSDRMSRTIRGLLDLSRRDSPGTELVDLRNVVNQALGLIEPMTHKNRVSLSACSAGTPTLVMADADQMRQVLMNLMVNAVEAMPDGGDLAVSVQSFQTDVVAKGDEHSGPCAVISVSDTGVGIPPKDIDQLFEPFFTTKDPEKGTGLGLSISADIVKAHGGRIEVKSVPGYGSVFTVYLPTNSESIKGAL